MFTVGQWSFLFIIFVISLSEGNHTPTLNDTVRKGIIEAKEYESIFQLFLSNDIYTTSRSLGAESEEHEHIELSTATPKEIFAVRFLRSESDDNEQRANSTVGSKSMSIPNRTLEPESGEYYYEPEYTSVGPITVPSLNGFSRAENVSAAQRNNTVGPRPVLYYFINGTLRAQLISRLKQGNETGRRYEFPAKDHVTLLYPAAVTDQTTPSTHKVEETKFWSPQMVDDYFLPYMGASKNSLSGDWVFYQKTANRPPVVGSTIYTWPEWRWTDPQPPDTFQRYCTSFYKRFGSVCGYRMNQKTFKYEYRTFSDWCKLENANYETFFDRSGTYNTIRFVPKP